MSDRRKCFLGDIEPVMNAPKCYKEGIDITGCHNVDHGLKRP